MTASFHLILLLLISTTADREHFTSHGGPIQGRSSADHHLRAHHSSRITGSSHADAGSTFAKEGATEHTSEIITTEQSPTEEPTLRTRSEALLSSNTKLALDTSRSRRHL